MTTEEKVIEIVDSVFSVPKDFSLDTKFDSLGFDSLDLFELIHETEEEFDISIDESEAEEIAKGTVNDLIKFVDKLLIR
jgi:acyl carrier protein